MSEHQVPETDPWDVEIESEAGISWAYRLLPINGQRGYYPVYFNPFNKGDELPWPQHLDTLGKMAVTSPRPSDCKRCAERAAWLQEQQRELLPLEVEAAGFGSRTASGGSGIGYTSSGAKLPTDWQERKDTPMATGLLDYFPDALAEVARVSKAGSAQHHPGEPLHWDKAKSTDHADCILRHLTDRGTIDTDGQRHSAKVAWRALAQLQIELENERATAAD